MRRKPSRKTWLVSITVQNTRIRSSLADIENQKVQTLDALKKEHGFTTKTQQGYSDKVAERLDEVVKKGKVQGWTKEQYRAETRKVLSTVRQELRAGTVGLNDNMRPNAKKW